MVELAIENLPAQPVTTSNRTAAKINAADHKLESESISARFSSEVIIAPSVLQFLQLTWSVRVECNVLSDFVARRTKWLCDHLQFVTTLDSRVVPLDTCISSFPNLKYLPGDRPIQCVVRTAVPPAVPLCSLLLVVHSHR